MEGFGSKSGKILSSLTALTMACTPTISPGDEQLKSALISMENETGDLAHEFETAASKALASGEVFSEIGNQSGEVIMVDGKETFGCIDTKGGNGSLCEEAKLGALGKNPNQISLNRDGSTIITVGEQDTDIQIIHRGSADDQRSTTMFLTDRLCAINSMGEYAEPAASTTNPELVKECSTLRDTLTARFKKVTDTAASIGH